MCGIAGFLHHKPAPFASQTLMRMVDALAHRGPDGRGFFLHDSRVEGLQSRDVEGEWAQKGLRTRVWLKAPRKPELQVGLGNRRLAIVDRQGGDQPLFNTRRDAVIVFNGEIYNYECLRAELVERGCVFRSHSDTEVLVHLYEYRGLEGMLQAIEGMFAFALWDEGRGALYLARDRIGEKPLYLIQGSWGMAFASELRGLLEHPRFEREVDCEALGQFLLAESIPPPRTIYAQATKLLPGHWMEIRAERVRMERYWRPPCALKGSHFFLDVPLLREKNESFLIKRVERTIERAIEGCLIGEVPLGVLLSGGLDSGLVTALALKHRSKLKTFSMGFEEDSFDETEGARSVARHLGTEHHVFRLDGGGFVSLFDKAMTLMDEPLADGSFLPTLALAEGVREAGVSVVLSGDGGDEIFGGYPTYRAHRLNGLWRRCPASLAHVLDGLGDFLPSSYRNISMDFAIRRILAGLSRSRSEAHALWMSGLLPRDLHAVVTEAYRSRILAKILEPLEIVERFTEGEDWLAAARCQDLLRYLPDSVLVKMDRATMAWGLEARAPLLNHHVVAEGFALPNRWITSLGQTKIMLREIAKKYLPSKVVDLPKKGFGMPTAFWLQRLAPDLLREWLRPPPHLPRYFRRDIVGRWLGEHLEGRRDHRKRLWPILVFERWRKGPFGPDA